MKLLTYMFLFFLLLVITYSCPARPPMIRPWLSASLGGSQSASAWDLQNVSGQVCWNSRHPSLKRLLSHRRIDTSRLLIPSAFPLQLLTFSAALTWFVIFFPVVTFTTWRVSELHLVGLECSRSYKLGMWWRGLLMKLARSGFTAPEWATGGFKWVASSIEKHWITGEVGYELLLLLLQNKRIKKGNRRDELEKRQAESKQHPS